jgi:predicted peptidase
MKWLYYLFTFSVIAPSGWTQSSEEFAALQTGQLEAAVFDSLPYRIQIPKEVPAGEKLPLLLFLHGAGERGDDNTKHVPVSPMSLAPAGTFEKFPCIIVAPQCPLNEWWSGQNLDNVVDLIKRISRKLPVDENRIYITGLSMGGMGTWALLAEEPRLFAAAVPICGGGNPKAARKFEDVPIWAFHGDADPTVSVEKTREMIAALKDEGAEPKYTEYPGVGHNSWTPAYRTAELYEWLFAQKR